ncbi:RNA polymerase subunit sigma-24, partial [Pseudomonas sp. MWU12-2312b]
MPCVFLDTHHSVVTGQNFMNEIDEQL